MKTRTNKYLSSRVRRGLKLIAGISPQVFITTTGRIGDERSAADRRDMRKALEWINKNCNGPSGI